MATITDVEPHPQAEPVTEERSQFASAARSFFRVFAPTLVALVCLVAIFEILVQTGVLGRRTPSTLEIASATVSTVTSADLWTNLVITGRILFQGLLIGTVLGVVSGSIIGGLKLLDRSFGPLVFALYTTPFIALIPVLLIIFGFGTLGKTIIVSILVWTTVTLQVAAGIRNIDPVYAEVAASFKASWFRRWWNVMLPASAPFIIAGMRLGLGRGLAGVVVAEFETRLTGLGGMVMINSLALRVAEATVPALVLSVIGITLTWLLKRAEDRFKVWKV